MIKTRIEGPLARVEFDPSTLEALVLAGVADPELMRESLIVSSEGEIAATTYPSPSHPLGPPTISTTTFTIDFALANPTRITRQIMNLSLQRFILDRVFANGGGVTGGAVIYDELTTNELYLTRDVQRIAPGGAYPLVTSERLAPKIAEVEKWGGKTFITDEARDRNDIGQWRNRLRQLTNTIVRKLNQRAIEVLEASISASGQTTAGVSWADAAAATTATASAATFPAHDFALAQAMADQDELGITYNLWLLNPLDYLNLATIYGDALDGMLSNVGVSVYVSNRVTSGTGYALAEGEVGQMRVEQPLASATWRDEDHDRTWVKSGVRPVMFVDNPYAVLKFTGLAA